MSQWGTGPGYGAPRAGFGTQTQWNAPQSSPWGGQRAPQQQWNRVQPQGYNAPAPRRGGGGNAMRMLIFAIGAIIAGMFLISMLSGSESPTGGETEAPPTEYQNEDYQVPPVDTNPSELPMPRTYGEASDWLVNNPVYAQSMAVPVRCESLPINLMAASDAELHEHFNLLTGCLMRVFAPPVEAAGYEMVRPSVTVYSSPINTRCGTMPQMNAAYCSADQQVYYATDLPAIVPSQLQDVNYVVESVIAHEFAHAMQGRTGILISEAAWEQNSDKPTANEFARRLEVQADCWAGQFIQSVGQSVGVDQTGMEELSLLFYSIGDDQLTGDPTIDGNHGHGDSRRAWFLAGAQSTSMGTCNAFNAPSDQVR